MVFWRLHALKEKPKRAKVITITIRVDVRSLMNALAFILPPIYLHLRSAPAPSILVTAGRLHQSAVRRGLFAHWHAVFETVAPPRLSGRSLRTNCGERKVAGTFRTSSARAAMNLNRPGRHSINGMHQTSQSEPKSQ